MMIRRQIAAFAILAGFAGAAAASPTPVWPTNIVGTWTGVSNQEAIILMVSSESAGNKCQAISGMIFSSEDGTPSNMIGYYCPGSGAVEFMRILSESNLGNVAHQVYTGNLSQKPGPKGQGILIGGVFSQYDAAYGNAGLGQYSFSLSN